MKTTTFAKTPLLLSGLLWPPFGGGLYFIVPCVGRYSQRNQYITCSPLGKWTSNASWYLAFTTSVGVFLLIPIIIAAIVTIFLDSYITLHHAVWSSLTSNVNSFIQFCLFQAWMLIRLLIETFKETGFFILGRFPKSIWPCTSPTKTINTISSLGFFTSVMAPWNVFKMLFKVSPLMQVFQRHRIPWLHRMHPKLFRKISTSWLNDDMDPAQATKLYSSVPLKQEGKTFTP